MAPLKHRLPLEHRIRRDGIPRQKCRGPIEAIVFGATGLFLSHDHKTGYLLDEYGDLLNVFNNGGLRGAGGRAIVHAIEQGATTLDCFDGFLSELYAKYGFVTTGRTAFNDEYKPADWNIDKLGRPDVVFMAYQGGPRDTLRDRIDTFEPYHHTDGAYYADWEAAKSDSRGAIRGGGDD